MVVLMAASGFFSCGEAALFSLSRQQRGVLAAGSPAQRAVAELLADSNRVLTAILFWNLVINMAYFALASIVALRLGTAAGSTGVAQAFSLGALLAIIVMSELLPKNLGVLNPMAIAPRLARPLGLATRSLSPALPLLQATAEGVSRLVAPVRTPEPYLELADLEKAVDVGSRETYDNEPLLVQERQVVQRVVELADASAQDLMRPRRRCLVAGPPVSLADLRDEAIANGEYLLITESGSDEIASALPLAELAMLPPDRLDLRAEPVSYTPWCAPASEVLALLRTEGRRVAAVVNEFGETIGIVTIERLLDAVLRDATRLDPTDEHGHVLRPIERNAWMVSGSTPLRRTANALRRVGAGSEREETLRASAEALRNARANTVGGLLMELLHRPPVMGDRVGYGGLSWRVVTGPRDASETSRDAPLGVRLEVDDTAEGGPA